MGIEAEFYGKGDQLLEQTSQEGHVLPGQACDTACVTRRGTSSLSPALLPHWKALVELKGENSGLLMDCFPRWRL